VKIQANQLSSYLRKGLLPCYLVTGDEPLLVAEALDDIRSAAREAGFTSRDRHVATGGFDWSRLREAGASLSLFARRVPDLQVLVAIVSGVLSPACYRHPLTRIRRDQRLRQFLAEFLQVGQQVLFGRRFGLEPTVRFAPPLRVAGLNDPVDVRALAIAQARQLLAEV